MYHSSFAYLLVIDCFVYALLRSLSIPFPFFLFLFIRFLPFRPVHSPSFLFLSFPPFFFLSNWLLSSLMWLMWCLWFSKFLSCCLKYVQLLLLLFYSQWFPQPSRNIYALPLTSRLGQPSQVSLLTGLHVGFGLSFLTQRECQRQISLAYRLAMRLRTSFARNMLHFLRTC